MEGIGNQFNYEDFEGIENLKIGQQYKGQKELTHIPTSIIYFIKWYKSTDSTENNEIQEKVKKEFFASKIANHKNLNKLEGHFKKGNFIYFVFSYVKDGSLRDLLKKKNNPLDENTAFLIFYQLLEGIHFLHNQGFIHRDINPKNILISYQSNNTIIPQLCDYNCLNNINLLNTMNTGTPSYTAPEIFKEKKYNLKVDYWSLGVTYYEMLQGKVPWSNLINANNEEMIHELKKFNIVVQHLEVPVSSKSKALLMGLLAKEPEKRLDYWKIKKLPEFQQLLQDYGLHQPQDCINLLNKCFCYKAYKEEKYFKEANTNHLMKNLIQRVIHTENCAEYGELSCNIQNFSNNDLKKIEELCNDEIQLSSKIQHQNILPLYNYYYLANQEKFTLIYSYGNGGRLSELLQVEKKLPEKIAFKIFSQLADGLYYLHEKGFVHCNIDSDNVNLQVMDNGNKIYSLVGFGISNEAKKKLEKDYPPIYQSPEFIKDRKKAYQNDYWSLGILYYQMVKGTLPWKHSNAKTEAEIKLLIEEITSFNLSIIKEDAELELKSKDLLAGLLQYNLSERMGYLDIKKTDLWKKYRKKDEMKKIPEIISESGDPNIQ